MYFCIPFSQVTRENKWSLQIDVVQHKPRHAGSEPHIIRIRDQYKGWLCYCVFDEFPNIIVQRASVEIQGLLGKTPTIEVLRPR
jgi:hypothetical protein